MTTDIANYYMPFGLELFEGTLNSHIYPWHYHDTYTIVFIEEGSMKYVYTDKEIIVKSNQFHVVNPFISHFNFPKNKCKYKAFFLPINNVLHGKENNNSII